MNNKDYTHIAARLTEIGLRPTRQRCALALLIEEGGKRHLTAERLYEEAVQAGFAVSLATVYNALKQFAQSGLVREIHLEAGCVYYDTRTDPHIHYLIEESGDVLDADMNDWDLPCIQPPEGFRIVDVNMIVKIRKR